MASQINRYPDMSEQTVKLYVIVVSICLSSLHLCLSDC